MSAQIGIGKIQRAVAKECFFMRDNSKQNINLITKIYLNQLKKDGYTIIKHQKTLNGNARRVNFLISQEQNWHVTAGGGGAARYMRISLILIIVHNPYLGYSYLLFMYLLFTVLLFTINAFTIYYLIICYLALNEL